MRRVTRLVSPSAACLTFALSCQVVIRKAMLPVVVFIITTLAVFLFFFVFNPLYWDLGAIIASKLNLHHADRELMLFAVVPSILVGVMTMVNAVSEKPSHLKDASIPPRDRMGRGNYHE